MSKSELPPIDEDSILKSLAERYPNPKDLVKAVHEGESSVIPSMIEIMQAAHNSAGWTEQHLYNGVCSVVLSVEHYTKHTGDVLILWKANHRDIRAKWCSTAEGNNIRPLLDQNPEPNSNLAGVYKLLFFDILKDILILKAKFHSFDLNSRIGIRSKPYESRI